MFEAIKFNLTHLFDFNGREDRPTFWWYVLFLVILNILLSFVVSGPMVASSVSAGFQAAQSGVSPEAAQAQIMQQMAGQMGTVIYVSAGISVLMIVLFLAAFVRRVHDSGNSGWWAAVPVASQLASIWFSVSQIGLVQDAMAGAVASPEGMQQMMALSSQSAAYGLVGWIAPIVVIVFGVLKSSEGANQYG